MSRFDNYMKESVCVVIRNIHGQYLGVSRKNNYTDFGFPGGKLNKNEIPRAAACRELKEETGLYVTRLQLIDVSIRHFPSHDGKPEADVRIYRFEAWTKGELLSNEDLIARGEGIVKWCSREELVAGTFGKYNNEVLPKE